MGKYICKVCGIEFDRVGNAVYCSGPHFRPCPVCGRPVQFHSPADPVRCCSKECIDILAAKSKSEGKQRHCIECGKVFIPVQASQVYCKGPHTATCVICGNSFEYSCSPKERPKTCSRKCQEMLRSRTAEERYGVSNVSQLDEVRKKISQANGSEEVKSKRAATSQKNWGVDNPAKSEEVRKKMSKVMSSAAYLRNRETTILARYGCKCAMQNPKVLAKRVQTNLERYGSIAPPKTKETYALMLTDPTKVDDYLAFKDNPKSWILSHFEEKPTITQICESVGTTDTPVYEILANANCSNLLNKSYSTFENDIVAFIRSVVPESEIVRNSRKVIPPQEVDIYLPEYRLAIECNPGCTHNSSFLDPYGGAPKDYKYHQNKSLEAEKAGVFLFHIFGYEWRNKRAVIQSMLRNLLKKNLFQYGAREADVVELTPKECSQFLDENHRQGHVNASVRLGLKLRSTGELISVMTFGRIRSTIGQGSQTDDRTWELSRFCNKLNTSVAGAASKLFRHFIKTYEYSSIISFSDVAHTRGGMYSILGFHQDHMTEPSYVWVDFYDHVYYNRVSCQKKNLRRLLKDNSIDIDNRSEKEIMEDHKFARVYDSGVIRWSFIRP